MFAVPVRRLLIGVACPHEQRLVEVSADELERERKALGREAAWQGDGRTARHVERRGETRNPASHSRVANNSRSCAMVKFARGCVGTSSRSMSVSMGLRAC
jgi:hypothetical protein